ncbi:c-type cytochrome [Rhodocytophaga aerolata]|uniref:C-type cytochrome n=1 Tax=Rhodocytophaga aerolata TaxID=455078 RepID=A0ABT8R4A9_9BACT|nr:PVC-type heme-binding CxxCH protein [Rhodocytophaga aerolata]MDO1445480.1 c-type cytochrome [Rhodocytophaga aerolata]
MKPPKLIFLSFAASLLLVNCVKTTTKNNQPAQQTTADQPVVERPVTELTEGVFSGKHFSEHVRPTEARSPEEEQKGFKVPDGFKIELYASEPDIGKPINMAFDAQGRLWVTQSFEYPFAAKPGEGSDRLTILEDTNHDGKADRFTHVNDTLNIPIGVLPLHDGAVAYSIPHVYRFTDANNDGKAEGKKALLSPFGHKDTHGMVNNLVRGYDGWIHAGHGFSNTSVVAGADGDSIRMESGNTFRFRPDGSRVEQTTFGRVNPFGLAYDELGYLYSADCHTSPLYQLIFGADYPHFGKLPEGIGFGPDMKSLEEESTALAGLAYYASSQFPASFHMNFFIGDVVTCRVHRYSFEFKGTTPVGKKEEDFVLSADPWFRPVDVKMGPDGAIYIADFYNSIIGHYEVPLEHPKRDRIRGRIWRVSYKGNSSQTNLAHQTNWTTATAAELIQALNHDNLPIRMAAADQLADRIGTTAVPPLTQILNNPQTSARQYIHSLWVLHRLKALSDEILTKSAKHADPLVRVHAMRIMNEKPHTAPYFSLLASALNDTDAHVQRAAVEAIGKNTTVKTVEALLAHQQKIPAYDTHHLYTTRLGLRNVLRNDQTLAQVLNRKWKDEQGAILADVLTGVKAEKAALFLLDYSTSHALPSQQQAIAWQHIAKFAPASHVSKAINLARQQSAGNKTSAYQTFTAIRKGMQERETKNASLLKEWGTEIAQSLLTEHFPDNVATQVSNKTQKLPDSVIAQQRLAVEIAGDYKLSALEPHLKTALQGITTDKNVQLAAARSLLQLNAETNIKLIEQLLQDSSQPLWFRRQLVSVLGEFPGSATRKVLANTTNLSPEIQGDIAMALAGTAEGRSIIFQKVKSGEIFARTLQQPKIEERILSNSSAAQKAEYQKLIASLPPVSEEKDKLIKERLAVFTQSDTLKSPGKGLFVQNCSPCHRIGNEGGIIGPQLTGIGNWGATALAEKILDPNRNISEAFRTYTITLKNGKVLTGLYRRDEGGALVFADMSGKEFSVPKEEIMEQKASKYTLMPDTFSQTLSQEDFNALLSYLLSVK